uniref:SGNH_hydro domain-containing protein n=1 Tax=Angiostrongylus cantonensis TaxID=6313 RepID=A0A0K0D0X1_ANGCA
LLRFTVFFPREFRCQSMIVFGDSLSDDGVEAVGESHGFMRNSNGKVWPEYVEQMLQCDMYTNFAYSGAKSGRDNFYFEGWSGVRWQVEKYLESNLYISGEPLIIFQTGGVIDFFSGEKDATNVVANIEASIENITQAMSSGTLFVLSVLDLGTSPGVRAAEDSSELQQRLGELVSETNRHLARIVFDSEKGARRLYPKLRIRLLDINPLVLEAMNSLNITEPFTYHNVDIGPRSVYSYAYYDLWNPSTIVHNTLAEEIVKHLQNF